MHPGQQRVRDPDHQRHHQQRRPQRRHDQKPRHRQQDRADATGWRRGRASKDRPTGGAGRSARRCYQQQPHQQAGERGSEQDRRPCPGLILPVRRTARFELRAGARAEFGEAFLDALEPVLEVVRRAIGEMHREHCCTVGRIAEDAVCRLVIHHRIGGAEEGRERLRYAGQLDRNAADAGTGLALFQIEPAQVGAVGAEFARRQAGIVDADQRDIAAPAGRRQPAGIANDDTVMRAPGSSASSAPR